jgi:interferon regulatory factor 1
MFTGKHRAANDDEPKRWKANFRCALNSLPDVEEVKNLAQSRGTEPYKVFKLCPSKTRKGSCAKSKFALDL